MHFLFCSKKLIKQHLSLATNFNRLICFVKAKKWSIWSVEIEEVIRNSDGLKWKQIDALTAEQHKIFDNFSDIVVAPTQFRVKFPQ